MATLLTKACCAPSFGTLGTASQTDTPRALSFSVSFRGTPVELNARALWQRPSPCRFGVVYPRLQISAGVSEMTGSLMKGDGLRFGVVVGRFNEIITRPLLAGALETFHRYQVQEEDIDVIWVPGSFEIPVVAQQLALSGKYHAILCIGAVVNGSMSGDIQPKMEPLLATACVWCVAIIELSDQPMCLVGGLCAEVPCIFGVLTTENMEQAIDRAGGKAGNKGAEAAITALEMASLFQHHLGGGFNKQSA